MGTVSISGQEFKKLINGRSQELLGLVRYLSGCNSSDKILTRPLLGELLSRSMQLEELLDAYDARNNCQWCEFRSLIAAFKLFSDISYELLHIEHSLDAYRLLPIEEDFALATQKALLFTGDVVLRTVERMLSEAEKLEISIPVHFDCKQIYKEELPAGRLPHDCSARGRETASENVTLLATTFLNLAAESEQTCAAGSARPEKYTSFVSGSITEGNLRNLELRFHNMQSMYDTHVSGADVEKMDKNLAILRGHISVVFHLLRTATVFAHYYERHINIPICKIRSRQKPLVNPNELLAMMMKYSLNFISQYISCARRLCQDMLKRYAEVGSVEVPVPVYRGFHVRPATLISKLVLHYGSNVKMELGAEEYDASSSLELFRANEKINATKRHWLATEIADSKLVSKQAADENVGSIVRSIVLTLAEQGKLVLYEQPLEISETISQGEGTLLEQVNDAIAQLLAVGKVDITTDINVRFVGDKRVLADIKLLAENGYGEDSFGNNIALPEELDYLRR